MNPVASPQPAGRLEVIAGPMFSGKSEELMRRVRRAKIAGVSVLVITHAIDTRSDLWAITSHNGVNIPAVPAGDVNTLARLARAETYDLVAIDEAQFFGPDLVPVVEALVDGGATVIVEGLCVTFDGLPFEPMPAFMAIAEDVVKLTAVCTLCGRDAVYHRRLVVTEHAIDAPEGSVRSSTPDVPATDVDSRHIGGLESYVARCRRHFAPRRP